MTFLQKYEDKKIIILGYGLEGKSTYRLLSENVKGCQLQIMDRNVTYVKGCFEDLTERPFIYEAEDYLKPQPDVDYVFKSPGIPLMALEGKIPMPLVTSQSNEFIRAYRDRIIGITGTKGKSTTVSFLDCLLKAYGVNCELVGNIGKPAFDYVSDNLPEYFIYELSSHQLETVKVSPKYGAVLNLFEEHLDHYKSYDHYAEAKMNIGRFQEKGDLFVYGNVTDEILRRSEAFKGHKVPVGKIVYEYGIEASDTHLDICTDDVWVSYNHLEDRKLKGSHNLLNVGVGILIAATIGYADDQINYDTLMTFKGLPHRLSYVISLEGIEFYNDSISTIPQATIAAVRALPKVQSVIVGGMDRGIDYSSLLDFIEKHNELKWLMLPDTGHRLLDSLDGDPDNVYRVNDLEEAVAKAISVTEKGYACVLSPAAPSYGFFKNFEARGEAFEQILMKRAGT